MSDFSKILFNNSIYNNLIKRTTSNNNSGITIFLDEAHKIININSLPETSICRENNFEYIMAVQNKLLLELLERKKGSSSGILTILRALLFLIKS